MVIIREAGPGDTETLIDALWAAANWDGTERQSRGQIRDSRYVSGWPRAGDFGVVAEDEGRPGIGAAWCRYFEEEDAGYGYIANDIPELTIGVATDMRGQGVGQALLEALVGMADDRGCRAVSLSVEDGNAARHPYERAGFVVVGRNGGSDTLLRMCTAR